ncbi:MAG TPA: hypothetical protein DGD08_08540 [Gemmatimonas aurantiaca]|uniref:Phage major capsid protein n=2 Tax=Gemmatimonas aurantiaca TaxID=173480 RepID=C1A444_GEMAT|nr:hypothetical protein [Gemmatimonas aurantiaca]BAH38869.1 hypothetical protein GAU_1827 [Gemmatimonas aurantiaca T-27]HCT57246.1 hypothetical protein [Gemmatimonas aurantiaca]
MSTAVQYTTAAMMAKTLRKVAADAQEGFNFTSPEVDVLKKVPEADVDYSLRETLFPADLNETGGVASLVDFGKLANPSVTGLEEGIGYLVHFNKRFNRSTLTRLVAKGKSNQIEDQFKYSMAKSVKALNRRVSIGFWGSSSGILALTDTDLTTSLSQTLTMRAAHGVTGLDDAGYLADLFVPGDAAGNDGDGVAVLEAGVVKGVGKITAKSRSGGTITIAFDVAPTASTTNGLQIVLCNAIGSTLTQTDYNKALVGWADALTASALHSITHPEWAPAVYDTSNVRFSPLLYQRGRDEMALRGDGTISHVFWDAAVKRDAWDNRASLQRFNDTATFTLDADIKAKNATNVVSRFVPPGWVTAFDVSKAVKRVDIVPALDNSSSGGSEDGGKEYIDEAGKVYELNRIMALQWRNRRATCGWTGKTRS